MYVYFEKLGFKTANANAKGPFLLLQGHINPPPLRRHWGVPGGHQDAKDVAIAKEMSRTTPVSPGQVCAAREFIEEFLGDSHPRKARIEAVVRFLLLRPNLAVVDNDTTVWYVAFESAKDFEIAFGKRKASVSDKYDSVIKAKETKGYIYLPINSLFVGVTQHKSGLNLVNYSFPNSLPFQIFLRRGTVKPVIAGLSILT